MIVVFEVATLPAGAFDPIMFRYFDAGNQRLEARYDWRSILSWPGRNHFVLYWQGDDGQIRLYDGMNPIQISPNQ